jgi:predicted CopG family antitoxin
MVTIAITPDAFTAMLTMLPKGSKSDLWPDGMGGYFATLPNGVLDTLRTVRNPAESFSDVILRLATLS